MESDLKMKITITAVDSNLLTYNRTEQTLSTPFETVMSKVRSRVGVCWSTGKQYQSGGQKFERLEAPKFSTLETFRSLRVLPETITRAGIIASSVCTVHDIRSDSKDQAS